MDLDAVISVSWEQFSTMKIYKTGARRHCVTIPSPSQNGSRHPPLDYRRPKLSHAKLSSHRPFLSHERQSSIQKSLFLIIKKREGDHRSRYEFQVAALKLAAIHATRFRARAVINNPVIVVVFFEKKGKLKQDKTNEETSTTTATAIPSL
jgi:hypothetical protein